MAEYQGYKDHATLESLKNLAADMDPARCGSHSTDLGGPAQLAPLIFCYREELDAMLEAVKLRHHLPIAGPGLSAVPYLLPEAVT